MKKVHRCVKSTDGIHELQGTVYIPDGQVKALFHMVHGMTEHIERYDGIMTMMADYGYLCFGYDNLGHGYTARDDSELGFIAHKYGWKYLVEDIIAFSEEIRREYPNKKYILYGHSMGSFMVRLAAEKYGDLLDGLIICGTGGPIFGSGFGIALTKVIGAIKGEKYVSKFIENIAFSTYNKKFDHDDRYSWLTRDKKVREEYAKNKFCTFHFTVSAMGDLVTLTKKCNRKKCFENTATSFPIFIISGTDDPVGDYGNGVKKVFENYSAKAERNVKMKLYEGGRHEIHNEVNKEEVWNDILSFADKAVAGDLDTVKEG